jgi:hypothetical protein
MTKPQRPPRVSIPFLIVVNLSLTIFLVGTSRAQAAASQGAQYICKIESPSCFCFPGSDFFPPGCYPDDDPLRERECDNDPDCGVP